jgi:transcriptional regulator with XRE-family HTH domain
MTYRHASAEIDGARLRHLRITAGMTVTALAEKIGISPDYLSKIERQVRSTVAPATFVKICNAMGVEETDRATLLRDCPSAA